MVWRSLFVRSFVASSFRYVYCSFFRYLVCSVAVSLFMYAFHYFVIYLCVSPFRSFGRSSVLCVLCNVMSVVRSLRISLLNYVCVCVCVAVSFFSSFVRSFFCLYIWFA